MVMKSDQDGIALAIASTSFLVQLLGGLALSRGSESSQRARQRPDAIGSSHEAEDVTLRALAARKALAPVKPLEALLKRAVPRVGELAATVEKAAPRVAELKASLSAWLRDRQRSSADARRARESRYLHERFRGSQPVRTRNEKGDKTPGSAPCQQ